MSLKKTIDPINITQRKQFWDVFLGRHVFSFGDRNGGIVRREVTKVNFIVIDYYSPPHV